VYAPYKLFAALTLNRLAKLPGRHFPVCANYAKGYYKPLSFFFTSS